MSQKTKSTKSRDIHYYLDIDKVRCERCGYLRAERSASLKTDEFTTRCPRCGWIHRRTVANIDELGGEKEKWSPRHQDVVEKPFSAVCYRPADKDGWHDDEFLTKDDLDDWIRSIRKAGNQILWASYTIKRDGRWLRIDVKTGKETLIRDDARHTDPRRGVLKPAAARDFIESVGVLGEPDSFGHRRRYRLQAGTHTTEAEDAQRK
ncbi:MAG: hypothetical protein HN742_35410 [Lentisphaerae bacterium]|jgi:hypothetical protein|nr:hypothetical protein [Lentisphaerota bacterium]MBT4818817.1 hypothetical protein [Lentisphaerota bacterium]MBT5604651.1 hypothetical protein [Lentisphaerota bacterium]MBT7057439.1 hypothetical protein [Lentisphaerota bacterium]MBT7847212.1 hypothetical protein [Lentisphaerota bacterium]